MIDIGVNLTNSRFDKDLPAVLKQAKQAGLSKLIVTGTNITESEQALTLSKSYPGFLYSTAGVHPHDASSMDQRALTKLRELLVQPEVKSVGECGLDFNRNFSTPAEQEHAFIQQLELAVEYQLPVFMHERDASVRFIELVSPYIKQLSNAVVHCFTGTQAELEQYLALGLHIGITGWICDERRGQHLLDIVKMIPDNRLMLETDSPYLLPRSMRPKPKSSRNEPKYLPYIAKTIADARQQDLQLLLSNTQQTTNTFFNLTI
ncbi:TatD family hydrolase [Psychromonas sp. 14N.309.X.WAT.B.A12]|uniref:TatD family hydrolase n=1 Tax=Psychromonas sp. 14N.309.X.WAT.B.A12 TaxID=2998322 RepID=UPI0025B00148|nr:TatD family hydrolase [Psychromonas sp. 14N.309.X.WAT.B.A12]MDN2664656.1 TatD family hydrolase [Psychromonas sp. 14N.309.X.WAT.B.A12]